jgi:probable rRNA maturation factor
VAIVSDVKIHAINREHLDHDFPTDVISFLYSGRRALEESRGPGPARRGAGLEIEGELVVSDETALREAPSHGWPPASELELYLVHGLLHLCGYDDLSQPERRVMRRRERELMALIART